MGLGAVRVEGFTALGFSSLGFRVEGFTAFGFRGLGFRSQGLEV